MILTVSPMLVILCDGFVSWVVLRGECKLTSQMWTNDVHTIGLAIAVHNSCGFVNEPEAGCFHCSKYNFLLCTHIGQLPPGIPLVQKEKPLPLFPLNLRNMIEKHLCQQCIFMAHSFATKTMEAGIFVNRTEVRASSYQK